MSKLKPFDLEKAKAGEKFTHYYDPECMTVRKFLAVRSDGLIVYECPLDCGLRPQTDTVDPKYLRMVVEPKIYKGMLVMLGSRPTAWCDTKENRAIAAREQYKILTAFEVEYYDE